MQLDVYLQETAVHAAKLEAMLESARGLVVPEGHLSPLELGGVLHAIQVLVENAIGKAKQLARQSSGVTPVDAYSAFEVLVQIGYLSVDVLKVWRQAIGMRNRIVHDYLNLDNEVVYELLRDRSYGFIVDFLRNLEAGGAKGLR